MAGQQTEKNPALIDFWSSGRWGTVSPRVDRYEYVVGEVDGVLYDGRGGLYAWESVLSHKYVVL